MGKMNEYYDADIAEKYVIHIPKEKDCIYIAGYKIDGFDSLENFCEYLQKYREVEEELKKYKDLEEQGLLLKLPCKVGDTIYVIPSKVNYDLNVLNRYTENNRVYEQKVHSIQMWSNERYLLTTCDGQWSVLSESYKKTWFLTKEEAEKALAEMEE